MTDRAKAFQRLHALAAERFQMEDPHPILHQLAIAEFDVESMAHLSEKEVNMLYHRILGQNVDWKKVEALGVTKIPEMSSRQQYLIKKLQKELNWSDDYLVELAIKRYGYLHWKYLTGREAWAFCHYMIARKRTKTGNRANGRREKVSAELQAQ